MNSSNRQNPAVDPTYPSNEELFTDDPERQLSNDLENILKLTSGSSVSTRSSNKAATNSGNQGIDIVVKSENPPHCQYGNASMPSTRAGPFGPATYGQSHPAVTTEIHGYPSLSGADLETDDVPSFIPHQFVQHPQLQVTKIPVPQTTQGFSYGVFQQPAPPARSGPAMIDKQMKFEDDRCISDNSEMKHDNWRMQFQQQQVDHHQQQQQPTIHEGQDVDTQPPEHLDNMELGDEYYTFELDEIGEGPLHWLSTITDKTALAKNLEILIQCRVVAALINLQNKYKQTPLFLAVQQSNILFMAWLLDNGADPNIQGTLYIDRDDYIWRSPLHLAVMRGDEGLQMVQMLLNKSRMISIDLPSYGDKLTALHLALQHHSILNGFSCKKIILELIDRRADINIRDQSSSKTPCMMVVETRDLPLIQEFLEKFPADQRRRMLQEQTRGGDTCLHLAAGLSRVESADKVRLLRMLVTNGANGNIANNVKELPKDFARYEWNQLRRT